MSTALDVSINVLYVQGRSPELDAVAITQLRETSPELHITTIDGPAAALAELRRTPGWQALLSSPAIPQNEVLALITSLRRDRVPIAIVPIVDDAHQDLFASAVAAGADDVLVQREGTLVNVNETLTRIRQSPHLFPTEQRRRISVLYAGRDPLVWNLLDQVPFVKAERVTVGIDGGCPVRRPGAGDDSLRADAVIIDEQPGDAHPLQVLKSVKAQASDLPVIVLTSAGAADIATAALELGADDTVLKTGIFRRRLIATLRRVHQRLELTAQQIETKTREERLRQIVENVPTGIMVVAASGQVLAMNAAALHLFGATKPRDVVGRDFRQLVGPGDQDAITDLIRRVVRGDTASTSFEAVTLEGARVPAHIEAVVLERDARGGRGVVASVTKVDPHAETGQDRASELGELRDALQRMETHFAELEAARDRERTAWETERQHLEARLEQAERLAAERASLEARLDEVTAELARANQSFAEERQMLEARMQELEAAARDATAIDATRAELEHALAIIREQQQQAVAAHALERSGWLEIRSELEARVRDLGTTYEATTASTIAELQGQVRQLEQTLNEERDRWNTTRAQLEDELRDAREALWTEHNERDAARAAAETELAQLREQAHRLQADLDDTRGALDRTQSEIHATADAARRDVDETRARLEHELQETRANLERELAAAREETGAAWRERDETRTRLEQELQEARANLERELAAAREETTAASRERDETRARLEQELQETRATLERDRATWNDQRTALEADLHRASDAEGAFRELTTVRSRLEAELEEVRQQLALERGAAEASTAQARQDIERAEEATRALADEYDATRQRLQIERDDALRTLDAERQAWQERRDQLEADLAAVSNQAQIIQQRLEDQVAGHTEMLATERAEWQARLTSVESDLQRATETARQQEQTWAAERDRLQEAERHAQQVLADERGTWETRLAREVETLRQAFETAGRDRDAAMDRIAALTAERDDVQRRLEALTVELNDLRRLADEGRATHDALEAARHEIRQTDEAHRAERQAWDNARRDLERQLREAVDDRDTERTAWHRARTQLEADLRQSRLLADERERLDEALTALRADFDALTETLSRTQADHDHDRREIEALRASLADAETRQQEFDEALDRAARSAETQLARQIAPYEQRVAELEAELREAADRLARATEHADQARQTLQAEYEQVSEGLARLIASDAFGYAVTTREGELVKCNDAFARMFGFDNAPDALARTAGRLFPAFSNRPDIAARLEADGRVSQLASCVERIDGRVIRIIETAVVLGDPARQDDEPLVEHVVVAGPAGPTADEIQARRMQEVGALTTAMVPEIESLIMTVHERSVDLVRRSTDRRVTTTDLEALRGLAGQIASLVRQLAAFSRRQVRTPEPIDLGEAVHRAEPMLSRLVGDYIGFSIDVGATTPIQAHPEDLDQLLTSLVTYARDRLPAGGSVVVKVRQEDTAVAPDEKSVGLPGPVLSITASGYGVQHPDPVAALDLVAQRCGGQVRLSGEPGWMVRLDIVFPRCGFPFRPGWDWLAE